MTRQERFFVTMKGNFMCAPSTIGAPAQIHQTNRFFFKRTPEEKERLKDLKKNVINKTFTSKAKACF